MLMLVVVYFNETATTEINTYRHTLSLHDALPICATVVLAHADGAARAGNQLFWLGAQRGIARHVIHAAVLALRPPVEQVLVIRAQCRLRDAGVGKAQFKRPLPDVGGELRQVDHRDSIEGAFAPLAAHRTTKGSGSVRMFALILH